MSYPSQQFSSDRHQYSRAPQSFSPHARSNLPTASSFSSSLHSSKTPSTALAFNHDRGREKPVAPHLSSTQSASSSRVKPTTVQKRNNKALWAFILSLAGLFTVITAVPGVVLGHTARKEIEENPHQKGEGLAFLSICIGWVILAIVLSTFIVVLILRLFNPDTSGSSFQVTLPYHNVSSV